MARPPSPHRALLCAGTPSHSPAPPVPKTAPDGGSAQAREGTAGTAVLTVLLHCAVWQCGWGGRFLLPIAERPSAGSGKAPDMGPRLRLGEAAHTAEGPRREREGAAGWTYAEAEATQVTNRDEERTMEGAIGNLQARESAKSRRPCIIYFKCCSKCD